ncbi:hypothetical protein PIB30_077731 [Stylosanthes scabra]|uniref:Uncharacterized protein n=1 Tax=Stylosanthes scabra TaxID=79078 RepID=A0ABU6QRT8_9FABA|nr:hypothetical protein [Stylosanthes scabra]
MAKKKSYQNVRVLRVLSVADRELYGWVDEEIFTQPSVVEADMLPELRREMRLTVDRAAEGDFVLEAAGRQDPLSVGLYGVIYSSRRPASLYRVSEGSPVMVPGGG